MKLLKKINGKHTGLFAAGLLLGTAGVKILSSKDAKNVDRKSTRLNSSHTDSSRMPSSA